ncbi:MAG: hypothetical protein NC923_05455 [Candidatus Omnitrophica bacterium]|nr:hypothetical protein [Candidatus Omnitrophota bacterium]
METIEALLKKEKHSQEDFVTLIERVKSDYIPQLKNSGIPQHCGLCSIYRFCKIINHKLICPWC